MSLLNVASNGVEFLVFTVIAKGIIARWLADVIIRQAQKTEQGRLHLDRIKTIWQQELTTAESRYLSAR